MAIFVFRMKTFSRSAGSRGSRATSAAAYRSGEKIRDLRTGATYDHRARQDVLHKEIVLPRALEREGGAAPWARDRTTLWNAAEQAEPRRNSRVAREFMVALPHELKPGERVQLARGFARELVERYQNAVDLVIHAPRGDQRNFHAHLLATTREVTSEGLGRKTSLEWSGTERHRQGLSTWRDERTSLRERWAALTNEALKEAHLEGRVSHEYGPRDPTKMPRMPLVAYHIERRGGHSVVAERIRERHRAALEKAATTRSPAAGDAEHAPWLRRLREQAQSAWWALRERLSAHAQAGRDGAAAAQPRQGAHPPEVDMTSARRPATARTDAVPTQAAEIAAETAAVPQWTRDRQPARFSPDAAAQESLQRWKEYRAQVAANPDFERQQSQAAALGREAGHGMDLDVGL